ncbi:MAG: type VI secretion system tip protein VgrG [Deltaproteobacteria bacterium]|nr:type VI secretion system tip protein VgrG [Deltaproteobacteria bacterium]
MAKSRFADVTSPLGPGALLLRRMVAREALGRLFEFELDLLSQDEAVPFDDVLGQGMTVSVELPGGARRTFHGVVSQFAQTGRVGSYAAYRAVLRPWLWFLTRVADCRIFQEKKVPEIIKEVFRAHGFTDFDEALSGSYRTWDYCVQYRETDFNFVTRLMEHEGIYYYFKHEAGKHTLVLADSYSSHSATPGYETVPYYPPSKNVVRETDHVFEWNVVRELQPGSVALTDFDFEKPRAGLATKSSVQRKHAQAAFEVYDYPGDYLTTADGDTYARARVEELQARFEQATGRGTARGLTPGGLFRLTDYPRQDQNREYLVVSASHELTAEEYETGKRAGAGPSHTCTFSAIDSRQAYRSPRVTPKPVVQGPQTAIVVGKAGEEIWTDKYGRVKVQFHWDREGKNDEKSSCWVRVAQVWAGKNWGAMHIPRIGQEVIVDFLEGDPDHPIITGRVYNADNMPPYGLPDNATQSGIQSRSSKQGGSDNFNEIRFEDKKGEEELYIHAERNRTIVVEADENHSVGASRTRTVGTTESVTIGTDRTKDVGANETETIAANKTISVGANHDETIAANMDLTVGANQTATVGANQTVTVGAAANHTVGGPMTLTVGGPLKIQSASESNVKFGAFVEHTFGLKYETIGGVKAEAVGGTKLEAFAGLQVSVAAGAKIEKGPMKVLFAEAFEVKSTSVKITAPSIKLSSGGASITLKGGTVTIKGGSIKIDGSTKFTKDIKAPNFKKD